MATIKKTVVAAIIEQNQKIFIAKKKVGSQLWEFPGGKIEPGETPEEALIRELQEELGMLIVVHSFFLTTKTVLDQVELELHSYLCSTQCYTPQHMIDHEETRWIAKHEFPQFAFSLADEPIVQKLMSR